jgi:hypothetical protein
VSRARRLARVTWRRFSHRWLRPLATQTEGAIFVEYTTLLILVTLGASAATLTLGIPLLRFYRYVQMVIAVPFP